MSENLMNIRNARVPAQRAQMEDISKRGICPFDDEYLRETHREPIEDQSEWWSVTKNDYPYEGTEVHYLLICRPHVTRPDEIPPEAMAEFGRHIARLAKNYPGGVVLMRWGDTSMTGATISHLHAHFIVGGPAREGAEKLKASIGFMK
jgi:ATP adenylyltransferase